MRQTCGKWRSACIALLVFVGAVALGTSMSTAFAADRPSWLVGRWESIPTEDAPTIEYLEFKADGHFAAFAPNFESHEGSYTVMEKQIVVIMTVGDRLVSTPIVYDQQTKRLRFKLRGRPEAVYYKKIS